MEHVRLDQAAVERLSDLLAAAVVADVRRQLAPCDPMLTNEPARAGKGNAE